MPNAKIYGKKLVGYNVTANSQVKKKTEWEPSDGLGLKYNISQVAF